MFEGDPRLVCGLYRERASNESRVVPVSVIMDSDGQFCLKLADSDVIVQSSGELSSLADDTEYQVSPGAATVDAKSYDYFLESVNYTVMPDNAAAEGYAELRYYTESSVYAKILRFYHKAGDSTFNCNSTFNFNGLSVSSFGYYPMVVVYVKNVTGVISLIYSRRRRLI